MRLFASKSKRQSRKERQKRLAQQSGRPKRVGSIKHQIHQRLDPMVQRGFGTSKHADKAVNSGKPAIDKIYSTNTSKAYHRVGIQFATWCRNNHREVREIDAMKQYVPEYLMYRQECCKATTVYRDAAALAKLYQCTINDWRSEGVIFEKRHCADITKGRDPEKWKAKFSEAKHRDLVDFCQSCGLRRTEILSLHTEDVYRDETGAVIVHVQNGKGGKERFVTALNDIPLRLAEAAIAKGQATVFLESQVPTTAPTHWYRSDFARMVYDRYARSDIESLPRQEQYCPRTGGMDGIILDRAALNVVSEQLGHKRLDVVPHHYLYPR